MHTISRRLSILLMICVVAAILLVTLFVNITVSNKFNQYMVDIQNKRYERIVSNFEDAYKRDGIWTANTGIELMHEAYMGNYCITLMDRNKKLVWGMDPNDIKNQLSMKTMSVQENGVYTTKTFSIKSEGTIVGYVDIGQYSSVLLTEEDQNFKASINKSIIVSGFFALIIVSGFSLYFSRQFSIPIREVAMQSVRLSKGNFDLESNLSSNIQELEDLRKSVNVLAGKLKYQDTLRKKLVSDISHEIRTPLNILQNNLEAMIDGIYPVTNEKLRYLNDEVVRFGKLINNLNMLKEFESESMKLHYLPLYLDELITDICNEFFMASENRIIKIEMDIKPNYKYLINGDRDNLKQVFINLISNAIKYTPHNGRVVIKLYETSKNVVAEVTDNGIGINEEDLPFIFERLYRGDKSRHQIEGTGIGLTIVRNILQLHNASIDVTSEEGKGTTFKITFEKYVSELNKNKEL